MRRKTVLQILLCLMGMAGIIGAYLKGRNDVWIGEFKQTQANMLTLTQWETNHPPELREFIKARYYYVANRTPRAWVGRPYDYGMVSTNIVHLTSFKGPTSAQEEYRLFLKRFTNTAIP